MWDNKPGIIKDMQEIIDILRGFGVKPFLWAGTLLGAVREGTFIANDDDIDLAYISNFSNPQEVHEEMMEIYKKLFNMGLLESYFDEDRVKIFDRVENTGMGQAHVIIDRTKEGVFLTDLFTMWIDKGRFFDPWFGDIGEAKEFVYKDGAVKLDGVEMPGLENPLYLLEKFYGEDWRTPKQQKGGGRNEFRLALKIARNEPTE